jgi:preprotein translocase subunit SecF
MLDIIGRKNWYFLISLLVIIPGLISLSLWGLRLSIDFTGGSRIILNFPQTVNQDMENKVKSSFIAEKIEIVTTQTSNNSLIIRTKPLNEKQDANLLKMIQAKIPKVKQDEFETIGPVIGGETTSSAIKAILLASVLIILFIAIAFRSVPKPTSSWKFGVCAIIALLHDVLVLLGIFSLLGHFLNVEVDSLFVTAILTVIGFSVHDTIVVFDRIRENLRRTIDLPFSQIVNNSILQTLNRSLNTSLTAILVLFTLLIFGGSSLYWFIVALLIGIASGTYSSIFNASAILVLWQEIEARQKKKIV